MVGSYGPIHAKLVGNRIEIGAMLKKQARPIPRLNRLRAMRRDLEKAAVAACTQ